MAEGRKVLSLNKDQIQLTAIAAMTLDHIAWAFFPGYSKAFLAVVFHIFGRITAPVMWFFIAEGYKKTGNVKKYALRLFIFAVISHFAYCFFWDISYIPLKGGFFNQTSIIWGLFLGLSGIIVWENGEYKKWQKILLIILICALSAFADWSFITPLGILWFHLTAKEPGKQFIGIEILGAVFGLADFVMADKLYGVLQLFVCLSFPLIKAYNGEKGRGQKFFKGFFYIYYPAHLLIIGLIKLLL